MARKERDYQPGLIRRIERLLPGAYVRKIGADQGWPDLLILWRDRWALLEVKRSAPGPSDFEPNQEWYIEKFNSMSFSACIYPENEQEVLNALQQTLRARRPPRFPQPVQAELETLRRGQGEADVRHPTGRNARYQGARLG